MMEKSYTKQYRKMLERFLFNIWYNIKNVKFIKIQVILDLINFNSCIYSILEYGELFASAAFDILKKLKEI